MTPNVLFMRALEADYRQASSLSNRSEYKIYYGQVGPAPVLTLGLNPGGSVDETSEDGTLGKDGAPASASSSYFERMENDVLDCNWRESVGLRKLLLPLVDHDRDRFRRDIVKTNLAFRRSRAVDAIDFRAAKLEAAPFIEKIIGRVNPRLIVLTGPSIKQFLVEYARSSSPLTATIKAAEINQVVFAAVQAQLKGMASETIVVQVAHASQFSWTYERYDISTKLADLLRTFSSQVPKSKPEVLSEPAWMPTAMSTLKMRAPASNRLRNPRLVELTSSWESLGIVSRFNEVHHSASPKFSPKRKRLEKFTAWCDLREIKDENEQTIRRALDLACRVKAGQKFEEALRQSWAIYPIVTR